MSLERKPQDSLYTEINVDNSNLAPIPSSSSTNNLDCQDCRQSFTTISKLKYHRLKIHGKWSKKVWNCAECEKVGHPQISSKIFSTQSNLNRHLRNVHQTGPLLHSTPNISKDDLKQLETIIDSQQDCPRCTYCPYSTWDSYNLKVHIRKHTGNSHF